MVPAAGRATRISPLPCSKEIFPIGLRESPNGSGVQRPKVVSHYLLDKMRLAGIRKAYVVLREGKWDIPAYYRDGMALLDMHLAYLLAWLPYGPPFTVDQAYPFVRESIVAFGFPDIVFEPQDAFVQVLEKQVSTRADVVLGVWPVQPAHMADDRLEIDPDGRVRQIAVKSFTTDLPLTWSIAVWTPAFTEFMHAQLSATLDAGKGLPDGTPSISREMIMGHVMAGAVEKGLHVNSVQFLGAGYIDIGTPEALARIYAAERPEYLW